ncbi:MAG: cyclic nucleotide-binding and patatin-like phospholipase domain-containing protein [Myxococcota bacterium]
MDRDIPDPWINALRSNSLFAELEPDVLRQVTGELREVVLPPGRDLMTQGHQGDSLFVIVEGTQEVLLTEDGATMKLHDLGPGSIVGEIALLMGGERSATVRTKTDTRALELSASVFSRLVEQAPVGMRTFTNKLQERMRRVRVVGYLNEIFGELDALALREIEDELTWVRLDGGQELFHQGDEPDGAYILVGGRLRVVVSAPGEEDRVIDDVVPGEWVGEMALLTRTERSGTVFALRDAQLVWLSQEAFDRLVLRHPQAMLQITRLLVERMQGLLEGGRQFRQLSRTFAVVPARPGIEITGFCRALRRALSRYGSTLRLDSKEVDAALDRPGIASSGRDDPIHLRLAPWLAEQENAHAHLVLQADDAWTGWSETATRYADHILVVVDGSGEPTLGANERRLERRMATARAPKYSLVLQQRRGLTTFPGTARWLRRPHVGQHFHVRRGERSDVERLVRIITERAITLVLGGGGSRGYAHVGVLRAFEELGIPVDAIGGSSIGAVVAGSYALGLPAKELLRVLRPIFDSLIDPTLPIVSLASGRNAVKGTEQVVGSLDIEDLQIPYFAMSTNLTRNQEVVHREGSLALAARASGSLPGIFPPVPWKNGDLLVDGGVSNNVPVDVMESLFPGEVVAVDVMPDVDLQVGKELPMHLSGWRVAWQLVNPAKPRLEMPSILSILIRAATAGSHSMRRAAETSRRASLYLKPHVEQWNMLDFKAAPSIAEQGYDGTVARIKAWWEHSREHVMGREPAVAESTDGEGT